MTTGIIWWGVLVSPDSNLHIIACDVGQGDAMLISYKTTQFLIDGGPNNKVLSCLSKHVPFWDKTLEVVILTHPELDHFGGLIDVFKNYKVNYFLANQVDNSTPSYSLLKSAVGGTKTQIINPYTGFKLRYDLIYLDIFHPMEELAFNGKLGQTPSTNKKLGVFETTKNLNEFSIIGFWKFGDFKILTTGDIPSKTLNEALIGKLTSGINYLKVPHHGSKTGLTKEFFDNYKPQVSVISLGRNNIYHLPNKEILDLLKENNIKILRTDQMKDIEVITDGKKWWIK